MEIMSVIHMNGGTGEKSYANNSFLQRNVISMTRSIKEEAVTALYSRVAPHTSTFVIADLGCSSGPNTLFAVSEVIKTLEKIRCGHMGTDENLEYQVFLNDLPGNDFNAIFRSLSSYNKCKKMGSCYFNGVPGSFYDRLFPKRSVHFVHSSYSLHWLSKVPEGLECNKGNIYIASNSPQSVFDTYYRQFHDDFSLFLKHRAHELVLGGGMVLTFLGRQSEDPSSAECCAIWDLLATALNEMVSEGLIEEEKMDTFNVPNYTPSPSELKAVVLKEGSFSIDRVEVSEINWSGSETDKYRRSERDCLAEGYSVARCMRAVYEPLLTNHFGEGIIEDVFHRYWILIDDRMAKETTKFINVTISLGLRQT